MSSKLGGKYEEPLERLSLRELKVFYKSSCVKIQYSGKRSGLGVEIWELATRL